MRRTHVFVPALLLAMVACGDNKRSSGASADLASADDELLARAVAAASGTDALHAWELAQELAGGDATSCPRVEQQGDTTIVTGGCETAAGPIGGRVVLESDAARAAMTRISFEEFSDATRAIDGTIERAPDGSTLAADLSIVATGVLTTTSLALSCDDRDLCAVGDEAWVDVDGLGTADVLGAWRNTPAGGWLTLVGAQTLTLDLNSIVGSCIPYTVDGDAAGQLCL
jgi:hypothetical protein